MTFFLFSEEKTYSLLGRRSFASLLYLQSVSGGSSHINIQPREFVLMHQHASVCMHLAVGVQRVWLEERWRVVGKGRVGVYFQGICSNYMTKRWRVSPGAEQRLTGQGTEHSGPGNL